MKSTIQISDFLEFHYYGIVTDRNEVRKDCRCHECRQWVEETTTFFDKEETGEELELCSDCLNWYE